MIDQYGRFEKGRREINALFSNALLNMICLIFILQTRFGCRTFLCPLDLLKAFHVQEYNII